MSGDDEIRIILEHLAKLDGFPPPPGITPDQLATGAVPLSQLLRALGLAANGGDPSDMGDAQTGHAERGAKTGDAMAKFPANEAESAAKLGGAGSPAEMAQQIPQMISGVAGGISGAMQGLLQPLSQIPQQAAQIGQQMMQAGMGAMQHGAGEAAAAGAAIPGELTGSTSGAGAGGGGVGGLGATTPTGSLNPLPAPSAGTEPASAHTTSTPPPSASAPTNASRGGMGAMPMMPPGAMHGAGGGGKDEKPDTKRIVAPSVKNGAPVQGRITTPPPAPEVVKRVEGKPVASRRIILPDQKRDDDDKDSGR